MSTASSLRGRRARLRAGIAQGGLEYLFTAACSYLPHWLVWYRHHVLVRCAQRLRCGRPEVVPPLRTATAADAERLVGQGDITAAEVERYFERGDACVVATNGSDLLSTTWASRGTQYLVRLCLEFAIPDDAFYVHDTYTQPHARRRGLAGLCYQQLFEQLAAEGRTTAYAAIEVLNHGSRRAHARWGFAPVGRTLTLDVGPLRITYTPRWPVPTPRLALGWMRSQNVRLAPWEPEPTPAPPPALPAS